MATKPIAAKAEAAEPGGAPPKSKKLFLIVGAAVLVSALAAGGGWFYISKQRAAASEDGEVETVVKEKSKAPPTFMPLDNMVVNLADPGGEKVAQIGVTFEVVDAQGVDSIKSYLPAIRSGILLLISQRTSEELLQREGKEKLAADILREASRPFGGAKVATVPAPSDAPPVKKKPADKNAPDTNPVRGVLFSSFIIQ